MKYDIETTKQIVDRYNAGVDPQVLADELGVPKRSVVAKLSSLGVYQRKEYTNKRGEIPVKKHEYVENIANLLGQNVEILDSLEKANKNVLKLLVEALNRGNSANLSN